VKGENGLRVARFGKVQMSSKVERLKEDGAEFRI
jgi:hypothetical protein